MNWMEFENFKDYCKKTDQDEITALQTLLDHLEQAEIEYNQLKRKKLQVLEKN
jgi:hypothetical protein